MIENYMLYFVIYVLIKIVKLYINLFGLVKK